MTADEAALLAAVLADPAADLLRLVYADWLDDYGDPVRAAFIRLQLAIAWLPRPRCDRDPGFVLAEAADTLGYGAGWRARCRCRPCTLHRRQRELLQDRRRGWVRQALAPVYAAYAPRWWPGLSAGRPWVRPTVSGRGCSAPTWRPSAAGLWGRGLSRPGVGRVRRRPEPPIWRGRRRPTGRTHTG